MEAVEIPLDDLTEKVIELYWPQTRRWKSIGDGVGQPLRQSGQATKILDDILALRDVTKAGQSTLLEDVKKKWHDEYCATFIEVKKTLVRYPLRLLQDRPGVENDTFLYDLAWMKNPKPKEILEPGRAISLHPGVANALVRMSGLLEPALEYFWIEKVWSANPEFRQDGLGVKRYLFEQDRIPLATVRSALRESFGSACFYCNVVLPQGGHVDHVLPLSQTGLNGLANLVLSCQPCNTSKSDHQPSVHIVERALGLVDSPERTKERLESVGATCDWPDQYEQVKRAARNWYRTSPCGVDTWAGKGKTEPLPSELPAWLS